MNEKQNDSYKMVMFVGQAIVVAAVTWVGNSQVETNAELAGLRVEVANLKLATGSRYTAENAAADRRTQATIDAQQEREIGRLAARYEQMSEYVQELRRSAQ